MFLFSLASYSLNIEVLSDTTSVNNMASWVSRGGVLFSHTLERGRLLAVLCPLLTCICGKYYALKFFSSSFLSHRPEQHIHFSRFLPALDQMRAQKLRILVSASLLFLYKTICLSLFHSTLWRLFQCCLTCFLSLKKKIIFIYTD